MHRRDTGDTACITQAGLDYARAEGLIGNLPSIREQMGIPPRHGSTAYTTAWLNTPVKPAAPDPEVAALAGIESITAEDAPPLSTFVQDQPYQRRYDRHNPTQTISDFAPHLDWTIERAEQLDAFLITATRETFALPHANPKAAQYANGYPRCLIEIAQLEGGAGWVYAAGYSVTTCANHERLTTLFASKEAFPDRRTAIAAGIDLITSSMGSMCKWKLPTDIVAWLADPKPAGPHVVNGVDYLNEARANEARRASGILPRQSNSGGGAHRAPDAAGPSLKHVLGELGTQDAATTEVLNIIAAERGRQIASERYRPEHDDLHREGELAFAAAAYAVGAANDVQADPYGLWPASWDGDGFKPTGTIRDLIKAGALIVAEIERRQRAGEG